MIQTIKRYISSVLLASLFLLPLAIPATVAAQVSTEPDIETSLCDGANLQFSSGESCTTGDAETKVNDTIGFIINVFSVVVGVVAVIMIIVGGFKYITSAGDSNNVTSAKNTILYAIIGLVIVALAQIVVKFVLDKTAG